MILSVSAKVDSYSHNVLLCLPAADLDECALDVDNCTRNANCTNTPGSFFCTCEVGYSGDGTVECIGRIQSSINVYTPYPLIILCWRSWNADVAQMCMFVICNWSTQDSKLFLTSKLSCYKLLLTTVVILLSHQYINHVEGSNSCMLQIVTCYVFSTDINECEMNISGCEDGCTNNEGSFQCDCNRRVGYEVATNGLNCVGKYTTML